MYLVVVLDWGSRYVVSWQLDQTLEMPFVVDAVSHTLQVARPQIMNSDQGSHFTRPQYTDLVKQHDVQISMDGKGRAFDNIFTERLWRTVKYENVYLMDYQSPREARQGIGLYLEWYNTKQRHHSSGKRTPEAAYFAHTAGEPVNCAEYDTGEASKTEKGAHLSTP